MTSYGATSAVDGSSRDGWAGVACAVAEPMERRLGLWMTESLGFGLFLLATAALLVRPGEVLGLGGISIYEPLMIGCVLLSVRPLLHELSLRTLERTPVAALVLLMLAAVVLSHLAGGSLYHARVEGLGFAKVCIYFFLLLCLVDSPYRLRFFLHWIAGCALTLTGVAVLHYHGVVQVSSLETVAQRVAGEAGETAVLMRLQGIGIFGDPNDLSLLLVVGIGIGLWGLIRVGEISDPASTSRDGQGTGGGAAGLTGPLDHARGSLLRLLSRLFWLGAVGLFGYALMLTHSRGGFLALLGGMIGFSVVRWGAWRALVVAAVCLPLLVMVFAGRQTDLNLTGHGDTTQGRIQLWSEGLGLLRGAAVLGIGPNRYAQEAGQVAHNSFVQSYAELGLLGGTVFLGAFYVAVWSLWRASRMVTSTAPGAMNGTLQPYMMAIVCAYAVGLLSLSRAYMVPTYLVLGVAVVYLRLALGVRDKGLETGLLAPSPQSLTPRFDAKLLGRLGVVSVAFLVCTYGFIRVFVRW